MTSLNHLKDGIDASLTEWVKQSEERVVVLVFTADWAGSVFMFIGALEALEEKMAGRIRVVTVDVDTHPVAARMFNVNRIPTTVILRNREVVDMIPGTAPRNKLAARINAVLEG